MNVCGWFTCSTQKRLRREMPAGLWKRTCKIHSLSLTVCHCDILVVNDRRLWLTKSSIWVLSTSVLYYVH